jgi:ornithine carbamoyltransferase
MSGNLLVVPDLGVDGLSEVLSLAAAAKTDPGRFAGRLEGKKVGLFFEKPSTRTRVSCEVASVDLGAHPVVLKRDEVGLGSREAVEDVARVLDRYLDVLAFRVFEHSHLETIAANTEAPVINLLSNLTHPCQALADLQTIAEHRELPGTRLTYVGDGNNVAHSLMLAGAMSGLHVTVATPEGHEPAPEIVTRALSLGAGSGAGIDLSNDPEEAVKGADVVYTDVWASMGDEADAGRRREYFARFHIDERLFAMADPEAIFLHCLPAHRGEEVAHEVLEHQRSFVFDQAENRMHSFKGLLLYLADATA